MQRVVSGFVLTLITFFSTEVFRLGWCRIFFKENEACHFSEKNSKEIRILSTTIFVLLSGLRVNVLVFYASSI